MSAHSTLSNAAESPPIIVFQSRALRVPGDNDFSRSGDTQFSTPSKRSLTTTESIRTPTHVSKRARFGSGNSIATSSGFELCVQPVKMSFVLSGNTLPFVRYIPTFDPFSDQLQTLPKAPHLEL
jgi:hypothetical protein